MKSALVVALAASLPAFWLAGCSDRTPEPSPSSPPGVAAPAPEGVPANDPAVRRHERAAPPELQALVTGRFQPRGERATEATGAIEINDHAISAEKGDELPTERIAIVRGDDQFSAGERYSSLLMVGAEQPVELRRVHPLAIEDDADTSAGEPAGGAVPEVGSVLPAPVARVGPPLCASGDATFVALVMLNEGGRQVVRLAGLQGRSTPAAGASDIQPCAVLEYESR